MKIAGSLQLVCAILMAGATGASASTDLPPRSLSFAYRVTHPVFPLPQSAMASLRDPDTDIVGSIPTAATEQEEPARPDVGAKPRVPTQPALCRTVADVANANNLPIPFFANLIWAESSFNTKTISRAGAQGIAQFMPKTAIIYGLENPFDPIHAINVSARYLVELRDQFGNLGLAAAAYNAGPRRVNNWLANRGSLPTETQRYVRKITGRAVGQWVGAENIARAEIEPMPARAPCIEVAEAVLEQTRIARITNLMRELAASVPPPEEASEPPSESIKAQTMVAERKARASSRVANLKPSRQDKPPRQELRDKTRFAEPASAKRDKVEASASRKARTKEAASPPPAGRLNKSDRVQAKAIENTPVKHPKPAAPAKVASAPSKPAARPEPGRQHNKAARRTRVAYSSNNLH